MNELHHQFQKTCLQANMCLTKVLGCHAVFYTLPLPAHIHWFLYQRVQIMDKTLYGSVTDTQDAKRMFPGKESRHPDNRFYTWRSILHILQLGSA